MNRQELEQLTREQLIARAEAAGVRDARRLTAVELIDEIVKASVTEPRERAKARGWLGRARDLLLTVVDRGLTTPGGATPPSDDRKSRPPNAPPDPVPTVTLAEIYAAQGLTERALQVLARVLENEPDHVGAIELLTKLEAKRGHRGEARPADADASEARADSVRPEPGRETHETQEKQADTVAVARAEAPSATAPAVADPAFHEIEVDEIVGIAVDPTTVYLYWEVRPSTWAGLLEEHGHGWLAIRVVVVVPDPGGPIAVEREIPIDGLSGDIFVRDVVSGANVRCAIGMRTGDVFLPIAVGLELNTPRGAATDLAAGVLPPVRGTPPTSQPGGDPGHARQAPGGAFAPAPGPIPHDAPAAAEGAGQGQSLDITTSPERLYEILTVSFAKPGAPAQIVTHESLRWVIGRGGASDLVRHPIIERELVEVVSPGEETTWSTWRLKGPGGASDRSRGGASDLARRAPARLPTA